MTKVLHIIYMLNLGGAARAAISSAKYSKEYGDYQHTILSLIPPQPEAVQLAQRSGVEVAYLGDDEQAIARLVQGSDIVQLEWWNEPKLDEVLRKGFPPCRLLSWLHVSGDRDPQSASEQIIGYSDLCVPTSPGSAEAPALLRKSEAFRLSRTAMVYGCADFEPIEHVSPISHDGFRVGYMGTLHYLKMHPRFLYMSSAVKVPNLKVVVCGNDDGQMLEREAQGLGVSELFEFRGYVEDIAAELSTFDVYGYPLCEDTFASAELNLQEAMYAGIPPVVFPYGGVKHLVVNDYTGFFVHSEREYSEAIEFLYRNPEERARLGRNAKEYASQIFGARNAARKFHTLYQQMLRTPKRNRAWGVDHEEPVSAEKLAAVSNRSGAERFIDSLAEDHFVAAYCDSLAPADRTRAIEHEDKVLVHVSALMCTGGVHPYMNYYGDDPHLRYWGGLVHLGAGEFPHAAQRFGEAIERGFPDWRVYWRLALALQEMGQADGSKVCLEKIAELAPNVSLPLQLVSSAGL